MLRGQEVMADGYTESEQAARFDLHLATPRVSQPRRFWTPSVSAQSWSCPMRLLSVGRESPLSVTATRRSTAAVEAMLLAALRACRQYFASSSGSTSFRT